MTQVQLIRNFASEIVGVPVIIARERDDWGMSLADIHLNKPRLILPRDLTKNDEGDKEFRKDFVRRCPIAKGFSNITISILHELGHWFNPKEYLETDPDEYNNAIGWWHFTLPCEIVATDWAIAWLQDPKNRKKAKAFEREFFRKGKV